MASRRGNSMSNPPKAANRRRIVSARFPLAGEEATNAARKISLASSSIERP